MGLSVMGYFTFAKTKGIDNHRKKQFVLFIKGRFTATSEVRLFESRAFCTIYF